MHMLVNYYSSISSRNLLAHVFSGGIAQCFYFQKFSYTLTHKRTRYLLVYEEIPGRTQPCSTCAHKSSFPV